MGIVLHGVAAGKGIAIGRAHLVVRGHEEVPQYDLAENEIAAEAEKLFADLQQAFADKRHEEAAQLVRQGRFFDKLLREIRQA